MKRHARGRKVAGAGAPSPPRPITGIHSRMSSRPEVWLRGPLPDVPALLQPAAHSLLQSLEELRALLPALDDRTLRARPGGVASVAYHVAHAAGSLDRLLTYARGEMLSDAQLAALAVEGAVNDAPADGAALLAHLEATVERALAQLRATDGDTLTAPRAVGRRGLPSTVVGLLFHAAEHTQRHAGQALTTARAAAGAG
jgi:uncharacterized damage-inducible protein DinB